jgi:hypothetical protein
MMVIQNTLGRLPSGESGGDGQTGANNVKNRAAARARFACALSTPDGEESDITRSDLLRWMGYFRLSDLGDAWFPSAWPP